MAVPMLVANQQHEHPAGSLSRREDTRLANTRTFRVSRIGAVKQPAIVRGIVVYEDAEDEMAVVPTVPCELENKAGAAPD